MQITPKQQRFVDEYLLDLNATQAAIRAGYSEKTAKEQGCRLLTNVHVQAYLQSEREKLQKSGELTREAVLADIELIKQNAMKLIDDPIKGKQIMLNHNAALKAAELQAKHLGMFTDKVELTGKNGGPVAVAKVSDGQATRIAEEYLRSVKANGIK